MDLHANKTILSAVHKHSYRIHRFLFRCCVIIQLTITYKTGYILAPTRFSIFFFCVRAIYIIEFRNNFEHDM